MLVSLDRETFMGLVISLAIATWALPCAAQSTTKADHRHSTATKRQVFAGESERKASLEVLTRLRAMRDCWRDT